MTNSAFFSDTALNHFRKFCQASGINQKYPNPPGAFDAMPNFRAHARAKLSRDQMKDAGELQQMLRSKLDPDEFERLCAALNMQPAEDQEPEEPAPAPQRRGLKMTGQLAAQIMEFVGHHLTGEDRTELERLLESMMGRTEQAAATTDQPPNFPGKPLRGGGQIPLRGAAMDSKVVNYKLAVLDEQRKSFSARYPQTARLNGGTPKVEYRDGTPVMSPPTPRRSAAAAMAMDADAQKSFAERHPNAARIRVL